MKLGNHTQHMPSLFSKDLRADDQQHEYDLQFPLLPCAAVEGHTGSLAQTCQKKKRLAPVNGMASFADSCEQK